MMEYHRAQSLEEATRLLADDPLEARAISGGTAVVLMMRQGLIAPSLLVGIDDLPELSGVQVGGGYLRIGAATTLSEVARNGHVRDHFPSLAHACSVVANMRVRNIATLGGNLAEADYASDPPAVLASLEATCTVIGVDGSRSVSLPDLIEGFYSTSLQPGELITDIRVPLPHNDQRASYRKYVSRSSEDRPCVGVAVRGVFDQGMTMRLDVVVGAVAPTPQILSQDTQQVVGKPLTDESIAEIAKAYARFIEPLEDLRGSAWYRKRMIEVFVRRTLQDVRGRP